LLTIARVSSIELTLHWRWLLLLALGTSALAEHLLPGRVPDWDLATVWVVSAAAVVASEIALLLHELAHALMARRFGAHVQTIVLHGFVSWPRHGSATTTWRVRGASSRLRSSDPL
jgi:Zn-dependent protease